MRGTALLAALACLAIVLAAIFAPWLAPADPRDPASLGPRDERLCCRRCGGRDGQISVSLLGTDAQGADVLSSILFGLRVSLTVGLLAVALSLLVGVTLGLIGGYFGGWLDAVIMRAADVQLTFPAFLTALLIGGVTQSLLAPLRRAAFAVPVVVVARRRASGRISRDWCAAPPWSSGPRIMCRQRGCSGNTGSASCSRTCCRTC